MTIREEILDLADPDGTIYPAAIVTWAAANPASELYQEFEWNDAKAAHEHRLNQARRLVQLHITFADTGRRAVVSLLPDRPAGGGYRPLLPVLANQELRQMLVQQTLDEIERVLARYPQLDEIRPLYDAVEQMRRRLEVQQAMPTAAD